MNQTQPQRSPPDGPIQPQNPPPQTALGSTDETGLNVALITRGMPSLPFIYQDIVSRKEYIEEYSFTVQSKDNPGTTYRNIPVMSMLSEDNYKTAKGYNTPTMRQTLIRNCLNYTTSVHMTFLAIKPPMTSGKLAISWFPSNSNHQPASTKNNLQNMWIWDVGASPTFTIKINGQNLMEFRKTYDITANNSMVVLDEFSKGLGYFNVVNYQKYQPGGIFPQQFSVKVFRSLPDLTLKNPFHFDVESLFAN